MYQHYLEEALDMKSYLMVESRASGPMSDRTDPFTADDADLGTQNNNLQSDELKSSTSSIFSHFKEETTINALKRIIYQNLNLSNISL